MSAGDDHILSSIQAKWMIMIITMRMRIIMTIMIIRMMMMMLMRILHILRTIQGDDHDEEGEQGKHDVPCVHAD